MNAESSGYALQKLSEATEVLATSSDSLGERLRMARGHHLATLKIHNDNLSEPLRTEFLGLYEEIGDIDKLSLDKQQALARRLWSIFIAVAKAYYSSHGR